MPPQKNHKDFEDYLAVIAGSKEVGLAIAKSAKELKDLAKIMDGQGFKRSTGVSDLFKLQKTYLIAGEANKDVYDFAVQYPTGQVEIFDGELMRSKTFSPDYENKAIVALIAKDDLNKLRIKGFDLLSAVGAAYQS